MARTTRLPSRGVAQPGSAPGSGPGSRRFKSSRPDKNREPSKAHRFRGFSLFRVGGFGGRLSGWSQTRSRTSTGPYAQLPQLLAEAGPDRARVAVVGRLGRRVRRRPARLVAPPPPAAPTDRSPMSGAAYTPTACLRQAVTPALPQGDLTNLALARELLDIRRRDRPRRPRVAPLVIGASGQRPKGEHLPPAAPASWRASAASARAARRG